MHEMQKLKDWLLSCPYLGTDTLHTEHIDPTPGSSGLYPLGIEVLRETEDVLGNRIRHLRCRFALRQVVPEQGCDADRLLRLQMWVQEGKDAPVFGDVPEMERILAENGYLEKASQTGTAIYAVTLSAEFIKEYKEK